MPRNVRYENKRKVTNKKAVAGGIATPATAFLIFLSSIWQAPFACDIFNNHSADLSKALVFQREFVFTEIDHALVSHFAQLV